MSAMAAAPSTKVVVPARGCAVGPPARGVRAPRGFAGSAGKAGRARRMLAKAVPDSVVVQGFHWESSTPDARQPETWPAGEVGTSWYGTLTRAVPELAEAGITDIWLPPPSNSVAREGYLPSKLFELDGGYGSEAELRKLIQTLHAHGMAAVMDVVINHRCGDRQDKDGNWTLYSDEVSHDKRRIDWGPWALGSNHPVEALKGTGNPKDEPYYPAAPNVDHSNREVREAIVSWLNYMTTPRNIGFDSLRFDFVRGYKVEYLREYVERTVGPRGELCVAEYWDDDEGRNPRHTTPELLAEYVDKAGPSVGAFDFPLILFGPVSIGHHLC